MDRQSRHLLLIDILRDGQTHRAADLAARLDVTPRTIYRDMDPLIASGVPVQGTRGTGYCKIEVISLPPLQLRDAEMQALMLGSAIVAQSSDRVLAGAAEAVMDKLSAHLPERGLAPSEDWIHALHPYADAARGARHMGQLRAALRARQKLRITYHSSGDRITTRVIHPFELDYWGRVWTLTAYCELRRARRVFRVDLIQSVEALPELFEV